MALTLPVEVEDLQVFMGLDEINEPRAQIILDQIVLLCEALVDPLPDAASPIILSAASRSYAASPGAATSELVGPYQVTRPSGGLYLTKSEKAALRLLAGGGGAFSIDLLPEGYPESAFTE